MSIRTRTTLVTALFLFIASTLLSYLSYKSQRYNLVMEARERVELALSMLSEMSTVPLEEGDTFTLAQIVDQASRGQPTRVCIADRNGLILADSDHSAYDQTNRTIQTTTRTHKNVIVRSGPSWKASTSVLDSYGRLIGVVYVTFSTRPLDAALNRAALTVSSFALLSVLLAGVLAYFFGRYLTTAFNPVIAAIRQTAAGDLQSRINTVGISEIDEIAHAFNHMSTIIRNRVHTLEMINQVAMSLSATRSVEEFTQSLRVFCNSLYDANCHLLLGDPRTHTMHLIGETPSVRHVSNACLAYTVIEHRKVITIGEKCDYEPGTMVAEGYKPASAIVTPLITPDNGILGVLSVDYSDTEVSSPGREMVVSAESISILIAPMLAALQRSQTQEQAVDALRDILLPESPSEPEGVEVYAAYEVAEKSSGFGGDYYDVLNTKEDIWAFVIGDVSGKGLTAGRYTAMAKYAIRSFLLEFESPSEAVRHANAALTAQMTETMFLTLFLIVMNAGTRTVTYCSAGHLPVLHYSHRTGSVHELATSGMAMGLQEDVDYDEESLELEPGDVLMLYTDGLIEARKGIELYGFERLHEIFRKNARKNLDEAASEIIEDIRQFASEGLNDDLALMMVRVK